MAKKNYFPYILYIIFPETIYQHIYYKNFKRNFSFHTNSTYKLRAQHPL